MFGPDHIGLTIFVDVGGRYQLDGALRIGLMANRVAICATIENQQIHCPCFTGGIRFCVDQQQIVDPVASQILHCRRVFGGGPTVR